MIKIEDGIALTKRSTNRESKYPFAQMEVGQSFYVEQSSSPSSAATSFCRKNAGYKFVTRREKDGFRVWRIE